MVYALSTGIDMGTSTPMSDELRYVSVFISLAVTLVWCCVYFLRRKSLASLKHGIVFGIGITILSFFLDFVMWLPFVSQT